MNKMLDIYSDYLIAQNQYATAVGLSDLLEGRMSHDKVIRFLNRENFTSKDLWEYVKPETFLSKYWIWSFQPSYPKVTAFMRFLFVRSAFCIRLSSDSTSRRTPLPSLTVLLTRARKGLSPSSVTTYRSHWVVFHSIQPTFFYSIFGRLSNSPKAFLCAQRELRRELQKNTQLQEICRFEIRRLYRTAIRG
jgi:hypothetical protein